MRPIQRRQMRPVPDKYRCPRSGHNYRRADHFRHTRRAISPTPAALASANRGRQHQTSDLHDSHNAAGQSIDRDHRSDQPAEAQHAAAVSIAAPRGRQIRSDSRRRRSETIRPRRRTSRNDSSLKQPINSRPIPAETDAARIRRPPRPPLQFRQSPERENTAGSIQRRSRQLLADSSAATAAHSTAHAATPAAAAPQAPAAQFADANQPSIVSTIHGSLLPNGGTMNITLNPPDLGAMQITVRMENGVMSASFQTSNDQATRLLTPSLSQLKTALETQGVSVDRLHVHQTSQFRKSSGGKAGIRQRAIFVRRPQHAAGTAAAAKRFAERGVARGETRSARPGRLKNRAIAQVSPRARALFGTAPDYHVSFLHLPPIFCAERDFIMSSINSLASRSARPTASSSSASSTSNAASSLTPSDFIQFMVTELQNQDPLDPTDSNQMLSQMSEIGQLAIGRSPCRAA